MRIVQVTNTPVNSIAAFADALEAQRIAAVHQRILTA
jgi:hypothetical protein